MRAFARGVALGLLTWSLAAGAADIAVLPVGLSLAPGRDRAALTVTNRGPDTVAMQVETVAWTQADGQDVYAPTRDLLVNPPLFTLAPGGAQLLRVGLRQPASGERETAYRLVLRELPPPATAAGANAAQGQVRVLLQLRLPVYVEPARIVHEERWRAGWRDDGALVVTVANAGTAHIVVSGLALRAADASGDAPALAVDRTNAAVFPGQNRSWTLRPQPAMRGQRFSLEVTTDRGPQHVVLDPDQN